MGACQHLEGKFPIQGDSRLREYRYVRAIFRVDVSERGDPPHAELHFVNKARGEADHY